MRHLRFGFVVAGLLALVLLSPRAPVLPGLLAPLERVTAQAAAGLLAAGGVEVTREGAVLRHPSGFACEVYWRCTGLLPAVFLAGLILATPGHRGRPLVGAAAGIAVVGAINIVRIAHVFVVGAWWPEAFPWIHSVFWEGAIVALVTGLWLGWLAWSSGPGLAGRPANSHGRPASPSAPP